MNYPELDFKRHAKHGWAEDINRAIETHFLNLGIEFAKCYTKDKAEFRRSFKEHLSVQMSCAWIYNTYKIHGFVKEVLPEEGESKERLIGRKILEVFKVIIE